MDSNVVRLKNVAGMILIGDAALAFVSPRRHNLLWQAQIPGLRGLMRWFAAHPGLTRAGAVLQLGLGLWLGRSYQRLF